MRPPRKRKRPAPKQQRRSASSNGVIRRILDRISALRFVTFSLCLHTLLLLLIGGTVLHQVATTSADFEAGESGILAEDVASNEPAEPAVTERSEFQYKPTVPDMKAPPDLLVTNAAKPSTFQMMVLPKVPQPVLTNAMRDKLAMLSKRGGLPPNAGRQAGVGGARAATIFGRRIVASRLGVILDVSASGHSKLARAVTEIQRGFADATLILYPGCGMMQFPGDSELTLRKFSTIKPTEMVVDPKTPSTGDQLAKAMDVETFHKMATQPSVKDTLFVAWYGGTDRDKLIGQTQLVFMDLIAGGVDTIYWFSDFIDPIDPRVIDQLGEQLLARKIVLHAHNFAGKPVSQEVADWVAKLGGTVYVEGSN